MTEQQCNVNILKYQSKPILSSDECKFFKKCQIKFKGLEESSNFFHRKTNIFSSFYNQALPFDSNCNIFLCYKVRKLNIKKNRQSLVESTPCCRSWPSCFNAFQYVCLKRGLCHWKCHFMHFNKYSQMSREMIMS